MNKMSNFLFNILRYIVSLTILTCFEAAAYSQLCNESTDYGNYKAVIYYCKPSASLDDAGNPTVFMGSDNQQIIDTVKRMGCNTVFFQLLH